MLDTIMVPLDGSEFARQAVPRAISLARRADATLLLVRIHRGFPAADPGEAPASLVEADRELEEREREELSRAAEEVRREHPAVETEFGEGDVGETLLRRAEERADLVVMSTHGRGGFSRFWLGSVADELIRSCSVPLFLVRTEGPEANGAPERSAAPDLEHVLVPLDGSSVAVRVLEPATSVGELYGARFTLVRVVQPVMLPGYGYGDLPDGVDPEAAEAMEETARGHLERRAAKLREAGHRVDVEVVKGPSVPAALLEARDRLAADVIAMATRGEGGVKRMVLGSVADKVLRGSEGPLLVHNPGSEG